MNTNDLFTEMNRQLDAAIERQDELSERYSNAWGFYRGELPKVMAPGDIAARRVMWQAFESINPTLIAIFTDSQRSPVAFDSDAFSNSKVAAAVTAAVHAAALKIDGYYRKMMLAIKEILVTGNQAALVGYDSKHYDTDKQSFDNAPAQVVLSHQKALHQAGYNVESELTFDESDPENVTVTGWMQGVRDIKYPVIDLIAFKDFYLHPKAVDTATARYCGYSEEISVAEAIKRGYGKQKAEQAYDVDTNNGRSMDTSMLVVGDLNAQGRQELTKSTLGSNNDLITIYHHYWRGCYNSSVEKLYHVITTKTAYLEHEEVDYCPLVWGGMALVPGSAHSESLYDFCKSTQESSTRARRAIQRSADFSAYPDMEVVDSLLTDRAKAALNDRSQPGKIYLTKQKGAINRIPAPDVPNAMQLLNQEINSDVESVIQGSAGQAQALEKNAQASGTAIALTQNKQELNESQIAKTIAETFIKPMYRIMLLVLQEMGNQLDIDGVQVPFKMLRADLGLTIDVETEYDRAQAAANVMQAYINGAQTQTLPENFQPENAYNIFADYLRAATGQGDVSRYITAPEDMPQPSPIMQKVKAVIMACQLRATIAQTQLAEAHVQDMTADTQNKLNSAAKTLADLQKVLNDIDMDKGNLEINKLKLYLDAEQISQQAADDLTKNAIEQEKAEETL